MNLRTLTLIAVAVWAPIFADAEGAPDRARDLRRPAAKCLTKGQILADLRKRGYRARQKDMRSGFSGDYFVQGVSHAGKVEVRVNRCTGKILSVQAARKASRRMPSAEPLRKAPKLTLKCLSKQAIYDKLKARGYNYLKPEQITGPFNTPKGKVYRVQTLVKAGYWCQVKLTVNCYNAALIESDTIEESCIY